MFTQLTELDHINLSGMEIRSALYLLGWQSLHEFFNSRSTNDEILESLHKIIFIAQRRHLANGYIHNDWIINLRNIVRYLAEDALRELIAKEKAAELATKDQCNKFSEIMSPINNTRTAPGFYYNTDVNIAQSVCIFSQLPPSLMLKGEIYISESIQNGGLIAFGSGKNSTSFFPLLQFRYDGSLINGLSETAPYFQGSFVRHVNFLMSPHKGFDGSRPIDLLDKGDISSVVHAAASSKSPKFSMR